MHRHYEYIHHTGKRACGTQNIPNLPRETYESLIADANRHLATNARAGGWLPFPGEIVGGQPVYVHVWHPEFPLSEQMKRVNHIQNANGHTLLWTKEQIADADKPGHDITIAQFDKDGNVIPSMVIPPLARSQIPNLIAPTAGQLITKTIVIQDMGTDAPAPAAAGSPQGVTAAPETQPASNAPSVNPGQPGTPPLPIEDR